MINAHYLWLLLILFLFLVYESTQANGEITEMFDPNDGEITEMFDPNDRKQSDYWANYKISLKRDCNPDETDTGDHCVKLGCPEGMERGVGAGTDRCYPKCLSGYETNGMSRCYQACPPGYDTNKTQCIRPKHSYDKDIQPCRNCDSLLPPDQMVSDPLVDDMKRFYQMNPNMLPPAPVGQRPIIQIETPVQPVQRTIITNNPFRGYVAKVHTPPTNGMNKLNTIQGGILMEGFDGNTDAPAPQSPPQSMQTPAPLNESGKTTDSMTIQQSEEGTAMPRGSERGVVQEPAPATPSKNNAMLTLVEPTARGPHGMCPLGYTLSGNMCYENCPPHYRDEGNQCTRDTYVIDRPSYDRGGGVPYKRIRSKYSNVYSY